MKGGVFQGGPARYRDEYRGEQSSTIELGVPRHAIPPSAYDPRAMTRMCMSLNIRVDVRLYACVANVLHFSLSLYTRLRVERVHCHSLALAATVR